MSPVIYLQPVEAFTYYYKNKARLEKELVEIATNEETKTSVYITDEDGKLQLYVYMHDKKIFQSECLTAYAAERNLRMIYANYLTPLHVVVDDEEDEDDDPYNDDNYPLPAGSDDTAPVPDDEEDDTPPCSELDAMSDAEFEDMVSEREGVILDAVTALIEVLTEDEVSDLELGDGDDDTSIENIVDHIVEYLAIKCGFRIRRPMTLIDDGTGVQVRTEYPYEECEFDESELHG